MEPWAKTTKKKGIETHAHLMLVTEGPATQPMKDFERIQADTDAANQRYQATVSGALAAFEEVIGA